eukprot:7016298-Pyramimonas_sp.AAC.1
MLPRSFAPRPGSVAVFTHDAVFTVVTSWQSRGVVQQDKRNAEAERAWLDKVFTVNSTASTSMCPRRALVADEAPSPAKTQPRDTGSAASAFPRRRCCKSPL